MPANLSPEYLKAEERYRQAKTIEEKIAGLEEMLRCMPKHKGTEKLQADLKTRIAKLRRQPRRRGAARRAGHMVATEGAGQVALVGPPNAGKSALVEKLTRARPKVADYPFTTREPVPGMMEFEDIAFQLVDLPPLSEEHVEPWVFDLIRHADLLWVVVRATNSLDEFQLVQRLLREKHVAAYPVRPGAEGRGKPAVPAVGWTVKPALLVLTHVDEPGGPEDVEILKELLEEPWPLLPVSPAAGIDLDTLRGATFHALEIVRVYAKQPGRPAERRDPFTLRRGSTLGDLARKIHKELFEEFRFARIWGTNVFDGQAVQKDHVLADGDIVELHS